MLLRVGHSPSALALARYGKHLDLLEVRLDNGAPRRRTLEAMKSEAPADLVFAVLVPKRLGSLEQEETEACCAHRPAPGPALARASGSVSSSRDSRQPALPSPGSRAGFWPRRTPKCWRRRSG
jgi:hypothetical protein